MPVRACAIPPPPQGLFVASTLDGVSSKGIMDALLKSGPSEQASWLDQMRKGLFGVLFVLSKNTALPASWSMLFTGVSFLQVRAPPHCF